MRLQEVYRILEEEKIQATSVVRKASHEEENVIQELYMNAMTRRRSYVYSYLYASVSSEDQNDKEGLVIYDPKGDLSLGCLCGFYENVNGVDVLKTSHFAPNGMKAGVELMRFANEDSLILILSVTEDLSPMLRKIGFVDTGYVSSHEFDGEVENKRLFVNKSSVEKYENELASLL